MTLLSPNLNQFLVFVLVLTRISPLFMLMPVFGSQSVPVRVRALLAVGISLVITPLYWGRQIATPESLIELAVMMGKEAALGLVLSLGVLILFAGLQLAGQIIGQMSGMSLADVVSPGSDTTVPVFSQLFDLVTLAVFVIIGGHRQVIAALLDTFAWMPPGRAALSSNMLDALNEVMSQSFALGIRAAAPVMLALLLSVLIMGLISRTLPQLNVIAVGFSFNAMVVLVVLSISLGTAAWIFQDEAINTIQTLSESLLPATTR